LQKYPKSPPLWLGRVRVGEGCHEISVLKEKPGRLPVFPWGKEGVVPAFPSYRGKENNRELSLFLRNKGLSSRERNIYWKSIVITYRVF
jgi:hypothetical protein